MKQKKILRFLKPVFRYFNVLLPLIKPYLYINTKKGNIIMIQIENEYGSFKKCDKIYMQQLRDLVYSHLSQQITLYTSKKKYIQKIN